jgi:vacuolar-type H+-ATPase subunit H
MSQLEHTAVEAAEKKAEAIVQEAREKAERIISEAKKRSESENNDKGK